MKAAVVESYGAPPVYRDFPDPLPAPGEQLGTVTAAGLHWIVKGLASGQHYASEGGLPLVPGVDGVARLPDGRRVYFGGVRGPHGTMAERAAVSERSFALPDAGTDAHYAAVMNPAMSSWLALRQRAHFAAGESVLVLGATGASGSLALQIARHLGAGRVIAAGRNRAALAALDADERIPLEASAIAALGPVDVVLDYLWGDVAEITLASLAKGRTRYVQIGAMAGDPIRLPSAVLRSSAITLMGSGLGSVPWDAMARELPALLALAPSLALDFDTVPLRDVAKVWHHHPRRVVFVP
jgi:NADPH:quinone reductase-like Zn-dependent oxidoreductase